MLDSDHTRQRPLILLVEDNEDDAFLTLRALQKNAVEREDVMVVRDGVEALDFLFARGAHADRDAGFLPRLVLLDIGLPKLSGHEVLKQLRSDPRTRLIPVVMLTSSLQERDLAESYGAGANSYVQKPVNTAEFDQVVQQMAAYWLGLNEAVGGDLLKLEPPPSSRQSR